MSWTDREHIFERLERLGDYRTVSDFAFAYYGLIADYVAGEGREVEGVRLRVLEFLEVLERYHAALEQFTSDDHVTLGNIRSAAEKRDIGLRVLLEQLNVDTARGDAEIGRILLSAECYYQLALIDRVVERLELAVLSGADHPLVHFALGYNRYDLAIRAFTRYDSWSGERVIDDEDRYRLACLSAVSALQDGLSGGGMDISLHRWIGHILNVAGFPEAAQKSISRAEEMEEFSEFLLDAEDDAFAQGLEIVDGNGYDLFGDNHPITEDEVKRAGWLLRLSYSQSELLGE
ncbi:MAG TPA: hypothetical protein DEP45_02120 [Armatimonadetes bacterium]|nr:hypothetical protein [Armatimonadota bacterium]